MIMDSEGSRSGEWIQAFRDSFSPLRNLNLRYYLSGQAVSLIGTWLQMTAQGWVVWEISHSTVALGITGMLGTLPILLFGPWAGVLADRLDRRKVLVGTQTVAMLLAFALAVLTQLHLVQLWHVYVLSAVLGIVTALDFPSQQAFIGDMAGMGEVRRAVVLNAMIVQVSRTLGPALAGFIIGALGAASAFWLNGVSFLVVIGSLLMVRSSQVRKFGKADPLREFWEGLRFIGSQARLVDLILFVVVQTFLGLTILNIGGHRRAARPGASAGLAAGGLRVGGAVQHTVHRAGGSDSAPRGPGGGAAYHVDGRLDGGGGGLGLAALHPAGIVYGQPDPAGGVHHS